ncbi:MAG: chemotaxis response regulator protein-glutamate methylesterase [Candidatus Omnitrophica bacterium]|nr:chemotaxis response regulator protein-glutamate methylesterase [Candidatus Omnitrophota bacterium]
MIRVLIVDDSALYRKMFADMLGSDSEIQVLEPAKSGEEAILKVVQLKPDVVTLDINMPEIDGLTVLQYIMGEFPTPVVVVSANTPPGSPTALKAMEFGAVDVIVKPAGEIADAAGLRRILVDKIKKARGVDVRRVRDVLQRISRTSAVRRSETQPAAAWQDIRRFVAIGASTGGPKAIKDLLPYFPADISAAFLIVQHMPAGFTKSLAERLNWVTKIKVKEAEDGDVVVAGHAFVAPGDYHMVVRCEGSAAVIRLTRDEPVHHVRPSVTVMMNSLVDAGFGNRIIGVILTGMGSDGIEGMQRIKAAGGRTFAEDESTCVVYGMPRAVIEAGVVDRVVGLPHMGMEVLKCI